MKKEVSTPAVIAFICLALGVAGVVFWKLNAGPPPGPDPKEAMAHSGPASIQAAMAQGPPPGPPLPGGDRSRHSSPHP
jgi:hypothetical protein